MDSRDSIPCRSKQASIVFSSPLRPDWLWGLPSLLGSNLSPTVSIMSINSLPETLCMSDVPHTMDSDQ
jgi:hypothetical protein